MKLTFPTLAPTVALLTWASGLLPCGTLVAAGKVDFNAEVRPILSDHCFACHGPDAKKVKGGLRLDLQESATHEAKSGKIAVVGGQPEQSELVRRILSSDAETQMPPPETHKPLNAKEQDVLQRWIREGGEYKGHWAYAVPMRSAEVSGQRAIDGLVRARLTELQLQPAPSADRRTLIRRLSLDLTGLPPTPDEVNDFEQDEAPDAYERLVERLIGSPHYGERMAIGWLDVVRFADTIGYHSDNPRNIWPYRDYVIRSFNRNKPFDQFTREQLAGDLLPQPTLEQRVGSAFNRLLLTTEEGGAQAKDYEARYLTDRVRAIGAVWLGQTIGCAQCHDHKFDPITSRDFYSMGAFFADVQEAIIGRREDGILVPNASQAATLERLQARARAAHLDYDAPHLELDAQLDRWVGQQQAAADRDLPWKVLVPAAMSSSGGSTLKLRPDQAILAGGTNPENDLYRLEVTNRLSGALAIRLEVLPDDSLPDHGPGRAGNGNFVLTEWVAHVESGGNPVREVRFKSAQATFEQTVAAGDNVYGRWTANAAIDRDVLGPKWGWAVLPEVGRSQRMVVEFAEPLNLAESEVLVLQLRQQHGSGHNLGCFRLATTTDSAAAREQVSPALPPEIAGLLPATDATREKLRDQFKQRAPEFAGWRERRQAAIKAQADFESQVPRCIVTERASEPRLVRILPRGNFLVETGERVQPALPAFLVKNAAGNPGSLTRLDLANWLVSRDNPLTARVVMNRFWKQFFGTGLSKVLDDLGSQGDPPRNQALLDWLAVEFIESGWDVKHMVRLIVTSDTYRQTSVAPPELLSRDPDNRELARQGRWRLDAELVRDNALSVAGLLTPEVGGPSVRPYQPDGYWENLNFPQRSWEASSGGAQYRRGLYTWWQRSFLHPSLVAFDAPAREECTAERNRSNIPQQALVLLNDPTYVEAARAFAARMLRECSGDEDDRIRWGWKQALGRSPTDRELATVRQLLDKHLGEFKADRASAERYVRVGGSPSPIDFDAAELAAWMDVARTLLNLHETITRS
jgi:hypothetical protein